METGLSFADLEPESDERFVTLRRSLGVSTFGLNQIRLQPRQRGRIHRHARQEEVYLVLDGTLTLIVEGEEHVLERGRLVRVAPNLRRQLVNASNAPVLLIALGGAEEHAGRDGEAFLSWEETEPGPPQSIPMPPDLPG
jgi:quercetin dioxygenase-like cupin family protein